MVRTYKDKKGYKRYKNSGKSVHRHVASRKLGRPLNNTEKVHHINRDKSDNRRSNLWVFRDQKSHHKTHKIDKKRFGRW